MSKPTQTDTQSDSSATVVRVDTAEQILADVQAGLDRLRNAPIADALAEIHNLDKLITTGRVALRGAAREVTTSSAGARGDVVAAPAILKYASLKPGHTIVQGGGVLLTVVTDLTDRQDRKIGEDLAFIAAPENLPGPPANFNRNIKAIANLENWHGFNGWNFDSRQCGTHSYEDALMSGYIDGSTLGHWAAPHFFLVNGNDRYGRPVSDNAIRENMLVYNRDESSPLYNTFVTIRGFRGAAWLQSCTERPDVRDVVHVVHFTDGAFGWGCKHSETSESCVRPVAAVKLSDLSVLTA